LVVQLGSNGQGLLVEPPFLSVSAILGLDDHVSVVDKIKISTVWKLRDDEEWSFDIETEFFIQFSLSWLTFPFVNVDNVPLLMDSSVLEVDHDVSAFSINISLNFNNLSFFVGNELTIISEELPPSRVDSASHSDV